MNNFFYLKLAIENLKKHKKMIVPYLLSGTMFVMMFFVIHSLSIHSDFCGRARGEFLTLGVFVIAIFSVIFMFYTNSFLIKQRKSELGLYNILGLEKKHISRTLFYETMILGTVSIISGILCGMLFGQAIFLMLLKMVGSISTMNFEIHMESVKWTLLLFLGIYILISFYNISQIQLSKPIDLLRSKSEGEKEPKTKWIMALLGVVCLGAGYFLAITIQDPLGAITFFFVAVVLVIFGTYLLFTAGSIAFLKCLRKNKSYYYKTSHFVSVSNMIYRMKQNAVGLATICILSTMVLVMVSSTGSLFLGVEDLINMQAPMDINLTYYSDYLDESKQLDQIVMKKWQNIDKQDFNRQYQFPFSVQINQDSLLLEKSSDSNLREYYYVVFAYNEEIKLNENEIAVTFSDHQKFDTLQIGDKEYSVKNYDELIQGNKKNAFNYNPGFKGLGYIVMPSEKDVYEVFQTAVGNDPDFYYTAPGFAYSFNTAMSYDHQKQLCDEFTKDISEVANGGYAFHISLKEDISEEYYGLFGSFFFLGIFLSILFMAATVLIMYYKQISEGYDDVKRYEILQKVGMSHEEVKKSIHSQILIVFFMPLITAGIHIMFAFNMIYQIFSAFGMNNPLMLMSVMSVVFVIFSLFYFVVYQLTAKVYYKIVS